MKNIISHEKQNKKYNSIEKYITCSPKLHNTNNLHHYGPFLQNKTGIILNIGNKYKWLISFPPYSRTLYNISQCTINISR